VVAELPHDLEMHAIGVFGCEEVRILEGLECGCDGRLTGNGSGLRKDRV
jgi:hypothetical protein